MASVDHKTIGIIQGNEKFLRIKTLINHACYELYCKLFLDPSYGGFSREPDLLYQELLQHKSAVESLKDKGDIKEGEFLTVFPPSEETYLRECSLSLLHKLCQVCVKKFPSVSKEIDPNDTHNSSLNPSTKTDEKSDIERASSERSDAADDNTTYINHLGELQSIIHDASALQKSNESTKEFDSKWKQIIDLLDDKLGYDVSKVSIVRTIDNLDSCKSCHVAYLRSQVELLLRECINLSKTTDANTLTLTRLITNLKDATSLDIKGKKSWQGDISPLKEMKDLKDTIEISSSMLNVANESLQVILPELKFWKDKNIEGDIIILDETLNKIRVQVAKQSRSVSHYFNTVTFDIVKIKEMVSNQDENNVRYVTPHETDVKDKKISLGFVSIGF